MLKGLKVIQRYNIAGLLPDKGGLHTQLLVQKLREKLLMDADEVTELGMTTGVIDNECGNPVQNIGTESEPEYYCLVCDKIVEDVKGSPGQTVWDDAKDLGLDLDLKKAERSLFVQVFSDLDEKEEITPQHIAIWNLMADAYPSSFRRDEEDDE